MKVKSLILGLLATYAVGALGYFIVAPPRGQSLTKTWERMALPGELSAPHAFLGKNCTACHTPGKGVEAKNCIVCHADNLALLQRQPSAFHSDIRACSACHLEHQGRVQRTTKMDHGALARIGLQQVRDASGGGHQIDSEIAAWFSREPPLLSHLKPGETSLNCATCHQTKDRHVGLFGNDCAQCHTTEKWTLPDFRHPSSASQSCAQCHQAPPSHYMMHFKMISMTVAHMDKAEVNQCFLCHQTTSWNDIKGTGYYKHH